jgi:hypothetical protein
MTHQATPLGDVPVHGVPQSEERFQQNQHQPQRQLHTHFQTSPNGNTLTHFQQLHYQLQQPPLQYSQQQRQFRSPQEQLQQVKQHHNLISYNEQQQQPQQQANQQHHRGLPPGAQTQQEQRSSESVSLFPSQIDLPLLDLSIHVQGPRFPAFTVSEAACAETGSRSFEPEATASVIAPASAEGDQQVATGSNRRFSGDSSKCFEFPF